MERSGGRAARVREDETAGGIKSWPEDERPREKLFARGPAALTPSELIAILIRTGQGRGRTALDAARGIWAASEESWERLLECSPAELAAMPGLGPAKAASIAATLEIARRAGSAALAPREEITCGADVFRHFSGRLSRQKRECFFVLLLDAKGKLIREEEIAVGSLTECLVHPREAFRPAVRESAVSVVFVHNHPSGDPAPSFEDIRLTRKLIEAAKVLDIKLADHVIVGRDGYFSFTESGKGKV